MLTHAAFGSFTPEIKRVDCPDEDSSLCLEVRFETETDIAELDQKFEGDFSIYEGYFMNSGARVFASMPEFNNRMMNISSNLHVIHFRFIIDETTNFSFKYIVHRLKDFHDLEVLNSLENRYLLMIQDYQK